MEVLPLHFIPTGFARWVPSCCTACQHWPAYGLCNACYQLYRKSARRCYVCAIELPADCCSALCGQCLNNTFAFDHTIAAVSYIEPWSKMIRDFKFNQHTVKTQTIARLMQLKIMSEQVPLPDFLIPIPNACNRIRERGYNQAWEITKFLGRLLQIPSIPDVLIRHKEEASQTQRSKKERMTALKNAFENNASQTSKIYEKHVALIDDVMTTGATVDSAAQILKKAGARQVSVWVFARTPQERHQR